MIWLPWVFLCNILAGQCLTTELKPQLTREACHAVIHAFAAQYDGAWTAPYALCIAHPDPYKNS